MNLESSLFHFYIDFEGLDSFERNQEFGIWQFIYKPLTWLNRKFNKTSFNSKIKINKKHTKRETYGSHWGGDKLTYQMSYC